MRPKVVIATLWGVLIGSLTFAAGPIAWTSSHAVVAAIQYALTLFMIPGYLSQAW